MVARASIPGCRSWLGKADAEFVQCIECGEVFESSEFEDMNIEETKLRDDS